MNKIKYLLALIVFLATSCEIELSNRHHSYEFQGIHNR